MAGHSKFKNIMHRKGAQDAKRAKVFTKIIRELTVAARSGQPDPTFNPRLRVALDAAKAANMPKDNIDRAIKKAVGGGEGADFLEMRYEGYGPNGVAIIVESLTDNRNRTSADVRSAFTKYGGNLGETNSVSFMFDHVGHFRYAKSIGSFDTIFEGAFEAGAEDLEENDDYELYCALEDFAQVGEKLRAKYGDPLESHLMWKPKILTKIDIDTAQTLFKLIDVLEDNDDVQSVWSNFDVDEEALEALGRA